ncbi:MAG: phosphodiester glycosidase family protein [Lachnospiraceae bacterium]|nr:phosphodiester glycosidase family protein [Lachnospiraceae bacterium]
MTSRFSRYRHGIVVAIILTLFTGYALLDVFVIPHAYQDEASPTISVVNNSGKSGDGQNDGSGQTDGNGQNGDSSGTTYTEPIITDTSYRDANIDITITEYRVNDTNVYVADVKVASPEYLFTAFAKGTYGRNVKEATSQTASRVDAILAINGDFYGARTKGYVLRNGTLYRKSSSDNEDLVLYADGHLGIANERSVSAEQLLADGAVQVWSFGPALLEKGEITVSARTEVGRAMASNPRTALAQVGENHYLFVVSDGRTGDNDGLTLYELAQFLQSLGAETAYNLDGGGSSTMVFLGNVVNNPTTTGRDTSERSVSDIVCIGYQKN